MLWREYKPPAGHCAIKEEHRRKRYFVVKKGFPSVHFYDQDFVDIFLKCRGSIKDVERELGISYPTVRRRLDGVIRALGYQTEDGAMRRRDILKALDEKKMSPEEAVEALKGLS